MLVANQLIGFGAGGGGATISHTADAVDAANLTTYTFSAQALGDPASDREIIVGAYGSKSAPAPTISSVTIGGISATEVIGLTLGTNDRMGLWKAAVPSGATGDVVVTFSAGCIRAAIDVWRMTGILSAADDTGFSTADPSTDTLNIPAGGVAVGFAGTGGATPTYTWTNLAEESDRTLEGNSGHSGASASFTEQQTALSITADPTVSGSRRGFVIASFGPA